MALYTFDKNTEGKATCNDKCAAEWPPLAVTDGGLASGLWTIVTRDDGPGSGHTRARPSIRSSTTRRPGK
jgi:predicted lipoprotein with Yx(FWY)xxD motif